MKFNIGPNLKRLRKEADLTLQQVSERIGWSGTSRLSQYETGKREPTLDDIQRIATAINCTAHDIIFGTPENPTAVGRVVQYSQATDLNDDDYVFIDRYDLKLSAGCGSVAWVVHEKNPIAFRQQFMKGRKLNPACLKALYVKGDSMLPYLSDNDTVMIDVTDTTPEDGEVYAVCYDEEWYIKRIFKVPGGLILRSDNPKYIDIEVTGERAAMVTIFGRVVWRGG